MAIPRFFCDQLITSQTSLELPSSVAHHVRVRRLRIGQECELFDGSGTCVRAQLTHIDKSICRATILHLDTTDVELKGHITLVQGMASQDKMDWIIEKATELGVARLIVVQAQRSVVKLSAERAQRRAEHGRRLIESASEQCGRNHLMQLQLPLTLAQALEQCQNTLKLACLPTSDARPLHEPGLLAQLHQHGSCAIFIGPEGGWDQTEIRAMQAANALNTSLGARVLRTETAGLAAVAAVSALMHW